VYINGEEKYKLKNGGYQVYSLQSGEYKVVTDGSFLTWTAGKSEITVQIEARESVYVRLDFNLDAVIGTTAVTSTSLVQVNKEIALSELQGTKLAQ